MNDLKFKGLFNIEKNILNKIKEDFDATCCDDSETCKIIRDFYDYNQIIVDPHTATALKISNYQDHKNKQIFVLETAHLQVSYSNKKSLNKEIDFQTF